jgi:hypothetical protein
MWISLTRPRHAKHHHKPSKMPTAGYSGTPLLKKLGLKEDQKVLLLNPPPDYFNWLEKDISQQACPKGQLPDWVHLFAVNTRDFEKAMLALKKIYEKNSSITIWVSWYKKSAGIVTDLTEDTIRHFALQNGLVDVKVCAVSEQWSGLKLVVPLKNR